MVKQTALRSLETVARTIALPSEERPIRHPTYPSTRRTAVLGFQAFQTVTAEIASGRGMLFNQPGIPLWQQGLSTACNQNYVWSQNDGTWLSMPTTVATGDLLADTFELYDGTTANYPFSSAATNYGYVAKDGNKTYVYHPGGLARFALTMKSVGVFPNPSIVTVGYARWLSVGEEAGFEASASYASSSVAETGQLDLPAGWYRPVTLKGGWAFSTSGSAEYSLSFYGQGSNVTGYFPVMPLPAESSVTDVPYRTSRTTAVAVLFTNVTKALNKEGTVTAGRVSPELYDPWTMGDSVIGSLHPAEKYFGGLENGFYTYAAPGDLQGVFRDYFVQTSNGVLHPVLYLDSTSLFNAWRFADPDGATSLAVTLSYHVEFVTSSTIFNIGTASLPLEALHMAQIALLKYGFFFENPTHFGTLVKMIRSGLATATRAVMPYVPAALDVVAATPGVHPALRTGATIASRVVRTIQPSTLHVQTTPSQKQKMRPRPPKKAAVKVQVRRPRK